MKTILLSVLIHMFFANVLSASAMQFTDISEKVGLKMKPRTLHRDKKIARIQKNFEDVYAKGYFWKIKDICFADVNGDSHLDIFMLNSPHGLWSRLWLGDGKGNFHEVSSDRLCPKYFNEHYRVLPYDFRGNGSQDLIITAPYWWNVYGIRAESSIRLRCETPKEMEPGKFRMSRVMHFTGGYTHLMSDLNQDGCVDFVTSPWLSERGSPENPGWFKPGFLAGDVIELDRTEIPLQVGTHSIAADFDKDGRADVLSRGFWKMPSLLRNKSPGRFEDVTKKAGLAEMPGGGPIAVADFNQDGLLDIFCQGQGLDKKGKPGTGSVRLYLNQASGRFKDATKGSGLVAAEKKILNKFGTATVADFDNDTLVDLLVCDGEINRLYRNTGNGKFREITKSAGMIQKAMLESSNASGDMDMDGRIDVLLITPESGPALFQNKTENANHWIKVKVTGSKGSPQAAGAQVTLYHAGKSGQSDAILGYQEIMLATELKTPLPLHFGLGKHATCDIQVRFPDGTIRKQNGAKADSVIEIRLGHRRK